MIDLQREIALSYEVGFNYLLVLPLNGIEKEGGGVTGI